MTAAARVSRISPKQHAADKANLVKARAALKGRPRTARQRAASRKNLAKARQATHQRAKGKAYVSAKPAQAPAPGTLDSRESPLLWLPACGPLAVAEHLLAHTGAAVSTLDVLALWEAAGTCTIGDLLEAVQEHGLGGERLAYFERCDPDVTVPGLIYGVQLHQGYHAALAVPGGMISWCRLVPREGTPEEAWWLEWEGE